MQSGDTEMGDLPQDKRTREELLVELSDLENELFAEQRKREDVQWEMVEVRAHEAFLYQFAQRIVNEIYRQEIKGKIRDIAHEFHLWDAQCMLAER